MEENKKIDIIKSNTLIESKYSLGVLEQKVLIYAISNLKIDSTFVEFKVKDISDTMNISKNRHAEIRKISNNLMDTRLYFEDEKLDVRWIASSKYYSQEGKVRLEFSDTLLPYILGLKSRFTRYDINNVMVLTEKYSIRLYELLKQYEKINKRILSVKTLRSMLILENKYTAFKDFEKYVIKRSVEEINKETDLSIEYMKIKKGKKIEKIEFSISKKMKVKEIENEKMKEIYSLILTDEYISKLELDDFNFDKRQIGELYEIAVEKTKELEVAPDTYIKFTKDLMKSSKQYSQIENHFAYMKKALKEDFYKILIILSYKPKNK